MSYLFLSKEYWVYRLRNYCKSGGSSVSSETIRPFYHQEQGLWQERADKVLNNRNERNGTQEGEAETRSDCKMAESTKSTNLSRNLHI